MSEKDANGKLEDDQTELTRKFSQDDDTAAAATNPLSRRSFFSGVGASTAVAAAAGVGLPSLLLGAPTNVDWNSVAKLSQEAFRIAVNEWIGRARIQGGNASGRSCFPFFGRFLMRHNIALVIFLLSAAAFTDCRAQLPSRAAPAARVPTTGPGANLVIPSPVARAGAPPGALAIIETPTLASLSWDPMPNAASYGLTRTDTKRNATVQITPFGFTQTRFQDRVPDFQTVYRYTLSVIYTDGSVGMGLPTDYSSPALLNPPIATSAEIDSYRMILYWPRVAGAIGYRIDGPGTPPQTGLVAPGSAGSLTLPNLPAGTYQWQVAAVYPGGIVNFSGRAVVTGSVTGYGSLQRAADSLAQMLQAVQIP